MLDYDENIFHLHIDSLSFFCSWLISYSNQADICSAEEGNLD